LAVSCGNSIKPYFLQLAVEDPGVQVSETDKVQKFAEINFAGFSSKPQEKVHPIAHAEKGLYNQLIYLRDRSRQSQNGFAHCSAHSLRYYWPFFH
jgi:hypothetical protein